MQSKTTQNQQQKRQLWQQEQQEHEGRIRASMGTRMWNPSLPLTSSVPIGNLNPLSSYLPLIPTAEEPVGSGAEVSAEA
ncbi:hypothetical protein CLOM_g13733 [Closterium sp. NIES-68]|nr:hypothetical protein CLOM_g13733 [Closterium sp. NIES-68]